MNNEEIAEHFSLLYKLMEINGESGFKAQSYATAAYTIDKLSIPLSNTAASEYFKIKGIGESVGKKIVEILETNTLSILNDYINKTPKGVVEMLKIKGIGPKKINVIWKEMGLESIGELLYACNENQITLYKGFGEKTQKNIIEQINFLQKNADYFLYSEALEISKIIYETLKKLLPTSNIAITGGLLQQDLVVNSFDFITNTTKQNLIDSLKNTNNFTFINEKEDCCLFNYENFKIKVYCCENQNDFYKTEFTSACTTNFLNGFIKKFPAVSLQQPSNKVFEAAGLPNLPPFLRWNEEYLSTSNKEIIDSIIQENDIKGAIHNHSNWSDGQNSLEEMVLACMQKGFEYLVISDHSKAAFYANGLNEQKVHAQHLQIDELNKKYPKFKIFKSIECDILNNGDLDYDDDFLSCFDLVIASVHTNLKMEERVAMKRLITAIENRHTNVLGHPTGRLLLSRNGYELNKEKIIDACYANNVVIELNAHPRRLDLDYTWLPYALNKGVLISINPDAHSTAGLDVIKYGVKAAQKGMVTPKNNLSSYSLNDFEDFILHQKD